MKLSLRTAPILVFHLFCVEVLTGALIGYLICFGLGWTKRIEQPPGPQIVVKEEVRQQERGRPVSIDAAALPDTDGDGMPDSWETQFRLNPGYAGDRMSDFDKDGVLAFQEYELYKASGGSEGNPLGKWKFATVPQPTGFEPNTTVSVTLIETASNGIALTRVNGRLAGESLTTSYPYIYSPSTNSWTRVSLPPGFSSVTSATALDVNSSGQVVGYFTSGGTTRGFAWTPGQNGGSSFVFYLSPGTASQKLAYPKRISDTGHIVASITYINGPTVATDLTGRTISLMGSPNWASPVYFDVNDFGEFIGTVQNPMTYQMETFLFYEGYPFFHSPLGPEVYDYLGSAWAAVPDIDPAQIQWEDPENYYYFQQGTAIDQTTGETVLVHQGYGAEFYWYYDYPSGDYYDGWYSIPGYTPTLAAINDWGEFAGMYSSSMGVTEFDEYGSQGNYYQTDSSGLFLYDGSYHGTNLATSIYGLSNDTRVLIGTPFTLWSGSQLVPLTKLLPSNDQGAFVRVRLADNGLMYAQRSGSTLYWLAPADDQDVDGMPDDWEDLYGFNKLDASDGNTDYDGDGTTNVGEFLLATNPKLPPALGQDGAEIDLRPGIDDDADGMPNVWEWQHGFDHLEPLDAKEDADRDGCTNLQEFKLGTDPQGAPQYRLLEMPQPADAENVNVSKVVSGGVVVGSATIAGRAEVIAWKRDANGDLTVAPLSRTGLGNDPVYYIGAGSDGTIVGRVYTAGVNKLVFWPDVFSPPQLASGASFNSILTAAASPAGGWFGGTTRSPGESVYRSFVQKIGSHRVFLTAPAGLATEYLDRTNSQGLAAGRVRNSSGTLLPALWDPASPAAPELLPVPSGVSPANMSVACISDTTPVLLAGYVFTNSGQRHIFTWHRGDTAVTYLGFPANSFPSVLGATADGGVYGDGMGTPSRAWIASPGTGWTPVSHGLSDLSLMSYAGGCNADGEFVGNSYDITDGFYRPFVERGGKAYVLDGLIGPAGAVITMVNGIAPDGEILVRRWKQGSYAYGLLVPNPDTDGDGMTDEFEKLNELDPYDAGDGKADADGDNLANATEARLGTSITKRDTDNDGMPDDWERDWGLSPLSGSDAGDDPDHDRVSNLREYQIGTSPTGTYRMEALPVADAKEIEVLDSSPDGHYFLCRRVHATTGATDYVILERSQTGVWSEVSWSYPDPATSDFRPYTIGNDGKVMAEFTDGGQHGVYRGGVGRPWTLVEITEGGVTYPGNILIAASPDRSKFLVYVYDPMMPSFWGYTVVDATGAPLTFGESTLLPNYDEFGGSRWWMGVGPDGNPLSFTWLWDDYLTESLPTLTRLLPDGTDEILFQSGGYSMEPHGIFQRVDQNGGVLAYRYNPDGNTTEMVVGPNNSVWNIHGPGVGPNEWVRGLSRNGMVSGAGYEPWIAGEDGQIRLLKVRVINSTGSDLGRLEQQGLRSIQAPGFIGEQDPLVSAKDAVGNAVLFRLTAVVDEDADGLSDDWERSYIAWLQSRNDLPSAAPDDIDDIDPDDDPANDGVHVVDDYDDTASGTPKPWQPGKRAAFDYKYSSASAQIRGYFPAFNDSGDLYATQVEMVNLSTTTTTDGETGESTTEGGSHKKTTKLEGGDWIFNEWTSSYYFPGWDKALNSTTTYEGTWSTEISAPTQPPPDDGDEVSSTTTWSYPQSPSSSASQAKETIVRRFQNQSPVTTSSTGSFFPSTSPQGELQGGGSATLKTWKKDNYTYTRQLSDAKDRDSLGDEAFAKAKSKAAASGFSGGTYQDREGDVLDHDHRYYQYDVYGFKGQDPLDGSAPYSNGVESGYSELLIRVNSGDQPIKMVITSTYWDDFDDEPAHVAQQVETISASQSRSVKVTADPGSYKLVLCRVDVLQFDSSSVLDVNGGDHDGDQVPDFADGLTDVFAQDGYHPVSPPADANPHADNERSSNFDVGGNSGQGLVGGFGGAADRALSDHPDARYRISYPASDPASMSKTTVNGRTTYVPAEGSLRVWRKPLHEARTAAAVPSGDYVAPTEAWLPGSNLKRPDGAIWLSVESVRASSSIGDQPLLIEVDIDNDGEPDVSEQHWFSSVGMGYWQIDPQNGNPVRRLGALANSLPAPILTISQVQVTNPRPASDYSGFVADITVSGTVKSAVCDLTMPGQRGDRIKIAYATVNEQVHANSTISVGGSKTANGHMGRPYPFDGTFSHTMSAVPVDDANNVLRITVVDPLYSQTTQATIPFEISSFPPGLRSWSMGSQLDVGTVAAEVTFPGGDPAQALLTFGDSTATPLDEKQLIRDTSNPVRYASQDGTVVMGLSAAFSPNGTVQSFNATLTGSAFTAPLVLNGLQETAATSNVFIWAMPSVDSQYETTNYQGWDAVVDAVGAPQITGPGSHLPMALKVEGPEDLVKGIAGIQLAGQSLKVVKSETNGGYFVASEMDPERPATIMVVNVPRSTAEAIPDGYDAPPASDPTWVDEDKDGVKLGSLEYAKKYFDRNMDGEVDADDFAKLMQQRASAIAADATDGDFYKGVLFGLVGNPMDTGKDILGLFKAGAKTAADVAKVMNPANLLGWVVYEMVWGDQFYGEIDAAKRAWDTTVGWANEAGKFIADVATAGYQKFIEFMKNPALPGYDKLSQTARIAVDLVFMLLMAGENYWNSIGSFKRGYAVGYVAFEVIVSVGSAILTAPAGGSGALVTLGRHSPKILKLIKAARPAVVNFASKLADYTGLVAMFDKVMNWLGVANFRKWCFIAGTPVVTMAGPVPIEQIGTGTIVLSAQESGQGLPRFQPVLATHRSSTHVVWQIDYDSDSDPTTPDASLTASGGHPIWVEDRGGFVGASELQPGQHLRLAAGEHPASVTKVTRKEAPPGLSFKLYNLSVAEDHTYFAGDEGVWVHNLCPARLEDYWADFGSILEKLKGTNPTPDSAVWKQALEQLTEVVKKDLVENRLASTEKEIAAHLADVMSKVLYESNTNVLPQSVLADHWDDLVQQLASQRRGKVLHLERGNVFDLLRNAYYRSRGGFNQVRLSNGKILDSYIPGVEIVSRKYRQYASLTKTDFVKDLEQIQNLYKTIPPQSAKWGLVREKDDFLKAGIVNSVLSGEAVLEIPFQRAAIPADWIAEARTRGIKIRDVLGNLY